MSDRDAANPVAIGDARRPSGLLRALPANRSGVIETLMGYAAGVIAGGLLVAIATSGKSHGLSNFASTVLNLVGLWGGFGFAVVLVVRRSGFGDRSFPVAVRDVLGARIRPIDLPLGLVAGLFAQYVVAPVVEAPLIPFVPHLAQRLSNPANSVTAGLSTAQLVTIGLLVCVGSPLMEELFFRGVLLRGLAGATGRTGVVPRPVALCSVLVSAVCFGLAHFELIQLPGLIAAGVVFAALAASTGRLGSGFIAHVTFNAATIVTVTHLF